MLPMRALLAVAFCFLLCGCGEPAGNGNPARAHGSAVTKVGLSPLLRIDRKYKSMEGPSAHASFALDPSRREILWITAYRTEVVDADGLPAVGLNEFMCHNNLNFDAQLHRERFGLTRPVNFGRMFTASQGAFAIEFPEGFGIPMFSDELLEIQTMVLNHNHEHLDVSVRHRVTLEYVRDTDTAGRIKPLYPVSGPVMALLQGPDGYYGLSEEPRHEQVGASCAVGIVAPNAPEGTEYYRDREGRVFTQHWVVPPGREVRHMLITKVLNLPFDTRLHFVNAHLHPYAESVELRDLTRNETLFRMKASAPERGIGLSHVEALASSEGVPVYRDHEYEIVSVYENTTGVDQDAMAVLFMYFYDPETEERLASLRRELEAPGAAADGRRG
jgi:hypothetical protein